MDTWSELFGCGDGVFRQTGVGERRNSVGAGEREASDLERGLRERKKWHMVIKGGQVKKKRDPALTSRAERRRLSAEM